MEEIPEFRSEFNERYTAPFKSIVRILSSNPRAKVSDIANRTGLSRRTTALKIKAIERELGLSYTLNLNEEALGLNRPHLILLKFNSKDKPDYSKIREILKESHVPQLACAVNGTYDMLIYANALSGAEYAKWDKGMQTALSDYRVEWHASEVVHRQLGFFPIRNELLERCRINERYKRMLILLNSNSRMRFQELARRMEINFNTATYGFNNLMRQGYIEGFTVSANPGNISLMSFFSRYVPSDGYENASSIARRCFMSDDEKPLFSRYLITAPLIGSYDFFTLGAFDNAEIAYKNDVQFHKRLFKQYRIKMLYGEISELLLGRLPLRSIDAKSEYKTIIWE